MNISPSDTMDRTHLIKRREELQKLLYSQKQAADSLCPVKRLCGQAVDVPSRKAIEKLYRFVYNFFTSIIMYICIALGWFTLDVK